jgi:hypothetical protein
LHPYCKKEFRQDKNVAKVIEKFIEGEGRHYMRKQWTGQMA